MIRTINPLPRNRPLITQPEPKVRRFRKADVTRAIDAVRSSGVPVNAIEMALPGGTIRLFWLDARPANGDLFSQWNDRL